MRYWRSSPSIGTFMKIYTLLIWLFFWSLIFTTRTLTHILNYYCIETCKTCVSFLIITSKVSVLPFNYACSVYSILLCLFKIVFSRTSSIIHYVFIVIIWFTKLLLALDGTAPLLSVLPQLPQRFVHKQKFILIH